jgi:hypothetical protein
MNANEGCFQGWGKGVCWLEYVLGIGLSFSPTNNEGAINSSIQLRNRVLPRRPDLAPR